MREGEELSQTDSRDPLKGIPLCSLSRPVVGECGQTGTWRLKRPVLDAERCLLNRGKKNCHLCWLCCPEGVVSRTVPPSIDYDYCKGCGLCAEECPGKAIEMVDEDGRNDDD